MSDRVFIIAEAGVNHNGSPSMALQLVDVAAEAGADAIKFQSFHAESLVARDAPRAIYQQRNTGSNEPQFDMLRRLELDESTHHLLAQKCVERGIEFMSTAFDLNSLDLLARLGVARLKIPSGEITNAPLLLKMAHSGKPLIMSTGMATLADVEFALSVIAYGYLNADRKPGLHAFRAAYCSDEGQERLRKLVALLHCTTEYPAPFEDVNLRAMQTLRDAFGLPVGFSDHTVGIAMPIAAVALGAVVVEKHFTLDRKLPGPDHAASLEPAELAAMIVGIRQTTSAIGDARKLPAPSEIKNIAVVRKSLVAGCDIAVGERFSMESLAVRRPGGGISPIEYFDWLGRPAARAYAAGEPIEP